MLLSSEKNIEHTRTRLACAGDALQNLKLLHGASGILDNLNEIQFLEYFVKRSQSYLYIKLIVDFSDTITSIFKCLNYEVFGGKDLYFSEIEVRVIIQNIY